MCRKGVIIIVIKIQLRIFCYKVSIAIKSLLFVRIVIRVFGDERYYIKDLPIHKSQREIGQGEDYTDFELIMRPTIDLSTHFVSRSYLIKVLEPQWLADEIHTMHLRSVQMYELKNE